MMHLNHAWVCDVVVEAAVGIRHAPEAPCTGIGIARGDMARRMARETVLGMCALVQGRELCRYDERDWEKGRGMHGQALEKTP